MRGNSDSGGVDFDKKVASLYRQVCAIGIPISEEVN